MPYSIMEENSKCECIGEENQISAGRKPVKLKPCLTLHTKINWLTEQIYDMKLEAQEDKHGRILFNLGIRRTLTGLFSYSLYRKVLSDLAS